jgi:putative transposase
MPNTYTQLHIQFVFANKGRQSLIHEPARIRVEKFMTGTVEAFGHKLLAIYCMPDHTHLFIGMRPNQSISDLMREVKSSSSKFINQERLIPGQFSWQEGYGAFSYSKSHVPDVIHYVLNQPKHHHKKSFREEYLEFLHKFEIEYDEKYLFDWIE